MDLTSSVESEQKSCQHRAAGACYQFRDPGSLPALQHTATNKIRTRNKLRHDLLNSPIQADLLSKENPTTCAMGAEKLDGPDEFAALCDCLFRQRLEGILKYPQVYTKFIPCNAGPECSGLPMSLFFWFIFCWGSLPASLCVERRDTFLATLHRRRFEAVRRAHPYPSHARLSEAQAVF